MFKFVVHLLLLSSIVIGGTTPRAQSIDAAGAAIAAASFLQNFDEGESITGIYSTLLGDRFKKVLSANEFTAASVEALRAQLAGKPKDPSTVFLDFA